MEGRRRSHGGRAALLSARLQKGKRYPLAVQTHGGPQASDKFGMGGGQNYVPVLAAKGYAVLQPNYRGSTGYGDDFLRDMVGHYFQNAHLDVLAGVDYLIKEGIADPDHMVKMGWSGGGHMTNKIITVTDRFKAASAGAGAADWVSMYAQSDVRTYRTPWFGGTPWQKNAPISVYWDNSPLKDVSNVKTPTIFLVGQNDVRGAAAAIGGNVPGAEEQRHPHSSLRRAARAARMGRTAARAVQDERGTGLVREIRHEPAVHVGKSAHELAPGDIPYRQRSHSVAPNQDRNWWRPGRNGASGQGLASMGQLREDGQSQPAGLEWRPYTPDNPQAMVFDTVSQCYPLHDDKLASLLPATGGRGGRGGPACPACHV